jgi:hypothetical protein
VENSPELSRINENPVMAGERIGLTPMSPVMSALGTVLMPVFAKMTKSPAEPRSSINWGVPLAVPTISEVIKTILGINPDRPILDWEVFVFMASVLSLLFCSCIEELLDLSVFII